MKLWREGRCPECGGKAQDEQVVSVEEQAAALAALDQRLADLTARSVAFVGEQAEYWLRQVAPDGHPAFIRLCIAEAILHSRKNADYATVADPLRNFKEVGAMLAPFALFGPHAADPLMNLAVQMIKQLAAVLSLLSRGEPGAVEGVLERLADIGVFAKLAQILYTERGRDGR